MVNTIIYKSTIKAMHIIIQSGIRTSFIKKRILGIKFLLCMPKISAEEKKNF
jgi:hypothetical protein